MSRIGAAERLRRVPPAVADGALAVLFAGIAVAERLTPGIDYKGGPLAVDVPMTAVVVGSLAIRRAAPMRALLLACAALGLPTFFVRHDMLVWSHLIPLLILVYTVARHRPEVLAWAGGAIAAAVTLAVELFDVPGNDPGVVFGVVLFLGPVLGGIALRRNAIRGAAITAALARLTAERAARQRIAVLDERARVARDLHDVVAHAVSLMVVQARLAADALAADPAAAERSVLGIEGAGRAATAELRRMLGLLRDAEADVDAAPGGPAPGLAALDELVERMRGAGLAIRVQQSGARPALPAGFEVTAYRIVQEALTNVLTHAGPTDVVLALRYGDRLAIDVVDDGPAGAPGPATGSGHGLVGMRERVALLGGELDAGRHERGFAVRVRLPLPLPVSA